MDGMPWTVIVLFGPIVIMFVLAYLSVLSLVLSPIVTLITYLVVRGRVSNPVRYTLVAAVCFALFILPWIAMIVPSRFRALASIIVIACAYGTWLIGPLGFLFVSIDNEFFYGYGIGLLTGIVVAMGLTWVATLIWTIQSHIRYPHQCGLLPMYRVIVPSGGLFLSNMVVLVLLYL